MSLTGKLVDGEKLEYLAKRIYQKCNTDLTNAINSHGTHLTLGTGSGNAFRGDYGNTAYQHSQAAHAPSNAQKNSDITKAEIEAKLTGTITSHNHSGTYAAISHGNHVPATETANNAKFLRNDNTWATVTPANIGAAAASHGTHLTIGTGASNAAAGNHTHNYAASSHNHGLLHDSHAVEIANTTTDSGWSMINSSYNNGHILKSIRTNANAPTWLCNNYAAGVAFGGADTKGVLSCAYNAPSIKIAGGNGTKPVWWVGLTGTTGTTYDLNRINTAYTHSQATHAPTNAQKNSDITKAEIEAKLTGAITSHTHSAVSGLTFWTGSESSYNAISSKSSSTVYIIV